jgi:hypothetical protein
VKRSYPVTPSHTTRSQHVERLPRSLGTGFEWPGLYDDLLLPDLKPVHVCRCSEHAFLQEVLEPVLPISELTMTASTTNEARISAEILCIRNLTELLTIGGKYVFR